MRYPAISENSVPDVTKFDPERQKSRAFEIFPGIVFSLGIDEDAFSKLFNTEMAKTATAFVRFDERKVSEIIIFPTYRREEAPSYALAISIKD